MNTVLQVRARFTSSMFVRLEGSPKFKLWFFIGHHKNQLQLKLLEGILQVNFTLLDPVMSLLVRFQNKFFSRGSLHTLTSSYLLILILNDYQWWFWQIVLLGSWRKSLHSVNWILSRLRTIGISMYLAVTSNSWLMHIGTLSDFILESSLSHTQIWRVILQNWVVYGTK